MTQKSKTANEIFVFDFKHELIATHLAGSTLLHIWRWFF